jgi:OOP family OmpA-OmpF porin
MRPLFGMRLLFRWSWVLLILAISLDAHAQSGNLYLGGAIGSSKMSFDGNSLQVQGATASSLSTDDSSTGFKVYGGYRFHRNFAVELGIVDYGEFTATRTVTAPGPGSVRSQNTVTGVYGDLVGIIPVGSSVELFAKLGFIASGTHASLSTTGAVSVVGDSSGSDSETGLHAGLGAEVLVSQHVAIRLEYEQASNIGDTATTGSGDVRALFIGATYRY